MKKGVVKLVRDNVPRIITDSGRVPLFYQAGATEYRMRLRQKLLEEVEEFLGSEDVGEMADILELLEAFCCVKGIDFSCVDQAKKKKASVEGAFRQRLILTDIQSKKNS